MNINHSAFKPFLSRKENSLQVKSLQFVQNLNFQESLGKKKAKQNTAKQAPKLNKKYPTPQIQEIQVIWFKNHKELSLPRGKELSNLLSQKNDNCRIKMYTVCFGA